MAQHTTVLKEAAVDALNIAPDSVVVDATLGSGGHSSAILSRLGREGALVALDADREAIASGRERQGGEAATHFVNKNFRLIDEVLAELGYESVNAILADLGWRMEQFSEGGKGFSFTADEPLHMTYGDPGQYPFTATDIVNEWREEDIANVLKGYGEERFARRIARRILEERQQAPIETARQLAEIVKKAVPFSRLGKIHPATRTFQALRIAVNDELEALQIFIDKSVALLAPGGRLAIISFHSIEDRIVKHAFRWHAEAGEGKVVTKKPIIADEEEVAGNPRARSAKLRVFEKSF